MSNQLRGRGHGHEISPSTRGAVAYARNSPRLPLKAIQIQFNINRSTISDVAHHAEKKSQETGSESYHTENTASELRSGRHHLLSQEQIKIMTEKATSSYE